MKHPRWLVIDRPMGIVWDTVRADNEVAAVAAVCKKCGVLKGLYTAKVIDFYAVPTS